MASFLLEDLPSRGKLGANTTRLTFGTPPPQYVCDHDTEPPEGQAVPQDHTNVVIRALQLKKDSNKAAGKGKAPQHSNAAGKRPAAGGHPEGKRTCTPSNNAGAGPSQQTSLVHTRQSLESMSVVDLMDILKKSGLPTKGKKAELIVRILENEKRRARP